jgi:hypothetical protein
VWEVRVFSSDVGVDGSNGYTRWEVDKMIAVLLVRRLASDDECFASILMGQWSPAIMRAMKKAAKEHGFKWIKYERHGMLGKMLIHKEAVNV